MLLASASRIVTQAVKQVSGIGALGEVASRPYCGVESLSVRIPIMEAM
jgi:hypothetical protein